MEVTTPLPHGAPAHRRIWSKRRATSTMRRAGHAKYWSVVVHGGAAGLYVVPSRRHAGTVRSEQLGSAFAWRIEMGPSGLMVFTAVMLSRPTKSFGSAGF